VFRVASAANTLRRGQPSFLNEKTGRNETKNATEGGRSKSLEEGKSSRKGERKRAALTPNRKKAQIVELESEKMPNLMVAEKFVARRGGGVYKPSRNGRGGIRSAHDIGDHDRGKADSRVKT